MKWFVALVLVLSAYAGSASKYAGSELDMAVASAQSDSFVVDRDAVGSGIYALAVVARHFCPGSTGKTGPAGSSSCISDAGCVPNRHGDLDEKASTVHTLHSCGFRTGTSSTPLFRPPILTV